MPAYKIYVMKEPARKQFRSAPHVQGATSVRRKDYEEYGVLDAANEYAAWMDSRSMERPLDVGDLLEDEAGILRICKYVGFDAAQWANQEETPKT
jgi:hypothetical protein